LEESKAKAALADTYQNLERPERAIPCLSSVLSHMPDCRGMQSRLAALYAAAGNLGGRGHGKPALAWVP
jgi:hypothetical protein